MTRLAIATMHVSKVQFLERSLTCIRRSSRLLISAMTTKPGEMYMVKYFFVQFEYFFRILFVVVVILNYACQV